MPGKIADCGVIVDGSTLLNLDIHVQYLVRGALILAAVLINRIRSAAKVSRANTDYVINRSTYAVRAAAAFWSIMQATALPATVP